MSRFYRALSNAGTQAGQTRLLELIKRIDCDGPGKPAPAPQPETKAEAPVVLELVPLTRPAAEPGPNVYRRVASSAPTGPLFPFDGSDPRMAEQYRLLRTNLLQHPAKPRMLAVSSACAGDGKTITALNLAATLALKSDASVLVVDADLRQCSLAATLGIQARPGLADVLRGTAQLNDAIVRLEEPSNLAVLPACEVWRNPAELLDSPEWKALLGVLRARFSYVILDATPVAAVADYHLVEAACDGVILVLRPDHTRRAALQEALKTVPKAKLLGAVLNDVPDWFLGRRKERLYYHANGAERD